MSLKRKYTYRRPYPYRKPVSAPEGWLYVGWSGTRQIKDELKELGCQFCSLDSEGKENKGYYSPPENHAEATALLDEVIASRPDPTDMSKWSPVKGNTYDVKDALKDNFGARWILVVPKSREQEAQQFVLASANQ